MKANELRIGNYVYDNWSNEVIKLDETEFKVRILSNLKENLISPIELTEDQLPISSKTDECTYEFAFFTHGDKELRTIRIMFHNNGYWIIIDWSNGDGTRSALNLGSYKYLHELQNLYFALTNKELEL